MVYHTVWQRPTHAFIGCAEIVERVEVVNLTGQTRGDKTPRAKPYQESAPTQGLHIREPATRQAGTTLAYCTDQLDLRGGLLSMVLLYVWYYCMYGTHCPGF